MAFFDGTLEKLVSVKTDIQLRAIALVVFALMVLLACLPLATGAIEFGVFHATVVFLGTAGIIVVLLSERIVSLNLSKGELRLQLSELRKDVGQTITEFRTELEKKPVTPDDSTQAIKDRLTQAEKKVKDQPEKNDVKDMLQEARAIGQAMSMLREIMNEYRKSQS